MALSIDAMCTHLGSVAEALDVVEADAVHTSGVAGDLWVEEDATRVDGDLCDVRRQGSAGIASH